MKSSKAFISYSWDSEDLKLWVKNLAVQLRNNGIDANIDQWQVVPGDQMPHFMEKSVRENDFVLIVCTPTYKSKSDNRLGGVGYEGDIMTGEVLKSSNHRKFIPILHSGNKDTAIPSWLSGKYFLDFSSNDKYGKNFEDLLATLLNARETPPPIGTIPPKFQRDTAVIDKVLPKTEDEEIKIKGIIINEITQPLNDGTKGSALYKIPFELNKRPSSDWIALFVRSFDRPARFTTMHRPGIASVYGNKIYLDGTTLEEVERYHKDTLKLAVGAANKAYAEILAQKKRQEEAERLRNEQHRRNIEDISKRISFDD